jgi:hypothetical protein
MSASMVPELDFRQFHPLMADDLFSLNSTQIVLTIGALGNPNADPRSGASTHGRRYR